MSSNGEMILSKDSKDFTKFSESLTNIPFSNNLFTEKKIKSFTDSSSKLFIVYTGMTEPDWRIVTYVPVKKLYSDVDDLRNRIIILCLCTVILLSIMSIFMSFDLIKPINTLVKAMEEMSVDNIENSFIEVDRNDELGFLHKTFNKMAKEIDHLVTWIYREQLTRKEAEIKALQSQINPHFLFNTLESINWMARLNNVPEISETVSDLSTLLEASIGRDDKLITVEEEFMYIDKYIALLKRRFEDRITLSKEVDPKVLYATLPRLLIQPLIENAVYHGVENNRNNGIINLTAKLCEDNNTILIEIFDNGNGIPNEELIRLNKCLEMNNDAYFKSYGSKQNKSIGIENVNRRIKLFYGEKYGVKIESKVNIYTKVSVTFPVQNYNSKDGYYVQGSNN
jgi:two-component system sensor histidine kinase YesM